MAELPAAGSAHTAPSSAASPRQTERALTDSQLAKLAPHKLYLLIPTREEMTAVKALCESHAGDVPVFVKLKDEGIALLLSREYWCDASESTLLQCREHYGEQGVVLK
ncbi:MAG: hypothetical protein RSI33_13515 [Clostridia bacterium]